VPDEERRRRREGGREEEVNDKVESDEEGLREDRDRGEEDEVEGAKGGGGAA